MNAMIGVATLLVALGLEAAVPPQFVEIQRLYDQAGEEPQLGLISPDQAHFYVFSVSELLVYSLFPAGNPSPRWRSSA